MKSPWITIAIPSYNHSVQLLKTVQSVQKQTNSEWELCIVDDRSTDSAWHVAQMVASQDSRIHCEKNPYHLGQSAHYRQASLKGQAPYLLLLTVDNQLDPHFLDRVKQQVTSHPSAALVCGHSVFRHLRGHRSVSRATPWMEIYSAGTTVAQALIRGNFYVSYSSTVFVRDALQEVGGIPTDNPLASAYEVFVRIAARRSVGFLSSAQVYQDGNEFPRFCRYEFRRQIMNAEVMTLSRLLADTVVRQYLSPRDVQKAWHRIRMMKWMVFLSVWIRKTSS
ncbi:MAG: glycosyltransferase [Firmicutes bacterium]|jgi:glycosyltransferase involved in cell wall biosynthesis|nr:glycosyltransferase [Bacillota bacterium]